MDQTLEKIYAYVKGKNDADEITDEMNLTEMESIVRSCGTPAFSKAKGLFTKSKRNKFNVNFRTKTYSLLFDPRREIIKPYTKNF